MKSVNNSVELELEPRSEAPSETETTSILMHEEKDIPAAPSKKNPHWIGSTLVFGYRNGVPLFTIGPHCNILYPSL